MLSKHVRGSQKKTLGIDVADVVVPELFGRQPWPEVMRALPRVNDDVNEEWILTLGTLTD